MNSYTSAKILKGVFRFILISIIFSFAFTGNLFAAGDMQPVSFFDDRDPVPSNGLVIYTIEFENNTPDTAINPELNVTVPVGFTFVSTSYADCNYNSSNNPSIGATEDIVHCTAATFPGSSSADINITLRAPVVDDPIVFESDAIASCDNDANPANNLETVKTTVVKGADLNLTKTSFPNPVIAGGIATYRFDVVNNGPHKAKFLELTDTLPGGLIFFADDNETAADDDVRWDCSASGQNVTCTGKDLDVGAISTFYFRVKVLASSGDITNAATVTSKTLEVAPDDNTDTDTLNVIAGTDMGIVKSILTNPAISEQNVTFELNVTNHGPNPAEDVNITDVLPGNYTIISAEGTGWDCNINANPVTCIRVDSLMAVGASETITIIAQAGYVDDVVTHQNTAMVGTTTVDPIPENNVDTIGYDVSPDQSDLHLTKTKGPRPIAVGDTATSVITVRNIGPRDATPVQVVDVLSNNEQYISDSGTDWNCTHSSANGDGTGGIVTCDYANTLLISITAPTLTILTEAINEGDLTNTACTGGSGGSREPDASDKNTHNDCVSAGISATDPDGLGIADIRVIKTADDNIIEVDQNSFTYTVNVKNIDGNTSKDVEFRDNILLYVDASGTRAATALTVDTTKTEANCTITTSLVVCELGDIALNEEVNVTITVERAMADGNRINTASAYSLTTGDPDRSNNEDSVEVDVKPVADIEVLSKSVTPNPVLAGTEATYTIQIVNNGPSIARDVNITDIFTGEPFTFISASSGCAFDIPTDTLTCSVGDMVSGNTHSVELVIRPDHQDVAPVNWEINNTATVAMTTYDSNHSNNAKSATLVVTGGQVDLAIEKSESEDFHEPVSFDPATPDNNWIVYKVEIQNYGPSLATDIRFSDRVLSVSPDNDQNLTFLRDTGNSNGIDDGTAVCIPPATNPFTPGTSAPSIDCNISQLPTGDTYTRYLVFKIEDAPHLVSGDVYFDEINVTSREEDILLGNNVEDEKTTVRVATDPQIVKTVSKPVVEVGENFSFLLTVTNNGPGYSPKTNISDSLPAGMVLTGTPTTTPQGSCTGSAGDTSFTCNVDSADGTLHSAYGDGINTEVNITVPVMVTEWTQDVLNNIANVTTSGPDKNSSNNEDNASVTVLEPAHIGNRVWEDLNADGIQDGGEPGINGVTVNLVYEADGSIVQTTTTANDGTQDGIYNFDVNHSTDYRVEFNLSSPALEDFRITTENNSSTTDELDSDINATGATGSDHIDYGETNTTFDAGFFKVASIGNRVWLDNNGNGRQGGTGEVGVPDVNVTLYDGSGDQVLEDINGTAFGPGGVITTNASGVYNFTNLRPGVYYVVFDKTTLPANHVFTTRTGRGDSNKRDNDSDADRITGATRNATLTSDETDNNWDAGIYEPVSIGDFVWHDANGDGIQDSNENNLSGVDVALFYNNCTSRVREQNGTVNIAPIATDSSGYYLFDNLRPSTYCVVFTAQDSKYVITQQNVTAGSDLNDSDADPLNGRAEGNRLTSGEDDRSVDAGFYIPVRLGDRVWEDENYNGVQDNGERNVSGVTVTLVIDGTLGSETEITDENGTYLFNDLPPGHEYSVRFILPSGYKFTVQDQTVGADDETDSDANATGYASGHTSKTSSDDENLTFDAGIYIPVVIGNYVWEDLDADGIQESNEQGIDGVLVTLVIDDTVYPDINTTTDANGAYYFDASYDLKPNHTYSVQFSQPVSDSTNPYKITTQNEGSDDGADSDISGIDTPLPATSFMNSGDSNDTLDAGFYRDASLGNRVWIDANGNGIQDGDEVGQGNVTVRLYPSTETSPTAVNALDTNTTDSNGFYHFDNLRPGSYYVVFDKTTLPAGGYVFTQKDAGSNNNLDSDVNLLTGQSDPVTLVSNQDDNSTDAGIYIPVSIGDYAWVDEDGDGQQDAGEAVLPSVQVQLWNSSGQVTTDLNGTTFGTAGTIDTNATGEYLFDNLRPDTYYVRFTAPDATAYVITLQGQGNDNNNSDPDGVATRTGQTGTYILTSGEDNRSVDAGFYEPVIVGDRVWIDKDYNGIQDSDEENLSGVDVTLYQDGVSTGTTIQTDVNGSYLFTGLPQGHRYSVEFNLTNVNAIVGNDFRFTEQNATAATEASNSDANVTTGRTRETAFMHSGDFDLDLDAGVYEPVIIGDYVWEDVNGNGIQEFGEPGVPGVLVTLLIDGTVHTDINATTDSNGEYLFGTSYDLKPDHNYSVQFAASPSYFFTVANAGTDNNDSDPDASGQNVAATPTMFSGDENRTLDAGIYFGAALGNRVWIDANGNGIQDGTEAGQDNVTVSIYRDCTGSALSTQQTASDGYYHFDDLSPGDYCVEFTSLPAGYVFTQYNKGADNVYDSDVNVSTNRSDMVTLLSGDDNNDTDAGIYEPVEVGDRIWVDTNADGIQNGGELNYNGEINVTLIDNNDPSNTYTVTTNNGDYNIANVRPGNYYVEFTVPTGYEVSPIDALGSDDTNDSDVTGTTTANFDIVTGVNQYTWDMGIYEFASIGDRIWFDLNGDGVQDAGENNVTDSVTVTLLDDSNSTVDTQIVTNGSYLFTDLVPGEYHVRFDIPSNYVISPQDVNGTTDDDLDSDVNVTTRETEPTTLISGENDPDWDAGIYIPATIGNLAWLDSNANGIQDPGENGLSDINVTLFKVEDNGTHTEIGTDITDSSGIYGFEGLVPGNYYLVGSASNNYEVSPLNANGNSDEAVDSDFNATTGRTAITTLVGGENDMSWDGGLYELATIGDQVWIDTDGNGIQDDSETLDVNVTVVLYDNNGEVNRTTVASGSNGEYLFEDLIPSEYHIEFIPEAGSGYVFIAPNQGADDEDSDVNTTTGLTPVEQLTSGESNVTLDAGIYIPASLGDRVWLDANADGIQDPGEGNVSDINVTLYDSNHMQAGFTITDINGSYSFGGLVPGDYTVEFALTDNNGQDYVVTPQTGVQDDADNSDVNATGGTTVVTLVSGQNNSNIDAGLYIPVTIGDYVWSDFDRDGVQDVSELPIPGVRVTLYKEGNTTAQSFTDTNSSGGYLFENLVPGNYYVDFTQPAHYRPTVKDSGLDDARDSDANVTGETDVFTVVSPEDNLTIDAGFYELAVISGHVSRDSDNNDIGDVDLVGVPLRLVDSNGDTVATTTTDTNGSYEFIDVEPGNYSIIETQPDGMVNVSENEGGADNDGGNTTLDNNISVIVGVGENDIHNDFVEEYGVDIGDRIWMDIDGNGIQDAVETNTTVLDNISVNLYRDGSYISTTATDTTGYYLFENYPEGNYSVEFNLTTLPEHYGVTMQDQGSDDATDSDVNATTFANRDDNVSMTIEYTLLPGERNLDYDMGIYRLGTISGTIRVDMDGDDDVFGPNDDVMPGVQLDLLDENGNVVATTWTDENGYYEFIDVPQGTYTVREHQPDGYLDINSSDGDIENGDIDEITVIVGPGEDDTDNDFNEKLGGMIGDYVWNDTDADNGANGIQDANETGVNAVHVCLEDENGDPIIDSLTGEQRCTDTNATGYYEFVGLIPSDMLGSLYIVVFEIPNGTDLTPEPLAGNDISVDSNPVETEYDSNGTLVAKAPIDVGIGEQNTTIDMGLVYVGTAAIGDYIWQDKNRDGVQDQDEPGLDGVHVILYDENGTKMEEYITHSDGYYKFEHLYEGHYTVEFILPQDWAFTDDNSGGDDAGDSDADPKTGMTIEIDLLEGQYQRIWDAGVYCACEESANSSDSGDAMNIFSLIIMMFLTGLTALFFVRKEEEIQA